MREFNFKKKTATISSEKTSGSGKSRVAPKTNIHFTPPKRKNRESDEEESNEKEVPTNHKKNKKDTTDVSGSSIKRTTRSSTKKDIPEPEDPKPVREIFIEAMKEVDFPSDLIQALVIDLVVTDLTIVELYTMEDLSSCFETAKHLFDLLGKPEEPESISGLMKTTLPKLINHITRTKSGIYQCGITNSAHGFAIVVQGDSAELIQSFAGPQGGTLLKNIEEKLPMKKSNLSALLKELLLKRKSTAAQKTLFDGAVDVEKIEKDPVKNLEEVEVDGKEDIDEKEDHQKKEKKETSLETARKNEAWTEAHKDEQTEDGHVLFYRNLQYDKFTWNYKPLLSPVEMKTAILEKINTNLEKIENLKENRRW